MKYTKEQLRLLEVRPKVRRPFWCYVTINHYQNLKKDEVEYFKDWVEWDGEKWVYEEYIDCYVCFIHDKKD